MEVERVQSLAKRGLKELPKSFIRPYHERPENTAALEGVTVPVISMSQSDDVLVKEIFKATCEWGFFIITNHGVPSSLIKRLQHVGQEFFNLPQEEKETYANDPTQGKFEGYGTKITKNLDEKIEWIDYFFHQMAPPSKVNYDFWPKNPLYREVNEEYKEEMLRISDVLLKMLSKGLGLEENVLKRHLGGNEIEAEMKINIYPPCPQPELALGVEPHTDMSALTIIVQNEVPGLQVCKDGKWVSVQCIPDALFILVGDQIQVLSNGKYKSVLHRSLVNKESVRMSWAVFTLPPHQAVIGPLPQLLKAEELPKYATKTYADYRYRKFNKLPQ